MMTCSTSNFFLSAKSIWANLQPSLHQGAPDYSDSRVNTEGKGHPVYRLHRSYNGLHLVLHCILPPVEFILCLISSFGEVGVEVIYLTDIKGLHSSLMPNSSPLLDTLTSTPFIVITGSNSSRELSDECKAPDTIFVFPLRDKFLWDIQTRGSSFSFSELI
jgi:hypothetical protein